MAEFEDLQAEIAGIRAETRAAEDALRRARDVLGRTKRDRQTAARGVGDETGARLEKLDAAIAAQEALVRDRRKFRDDIRLREGKVFDRFAKFNDPRVAIERLSDSTPVCLMPLRTETRFKPASETGRDSDELWVRVYPDDIAVDTFEDTPSETEAQDARTYWATVWSAGGDKGQERGAWAVMLAGQGAGRSHWITQAYAPLNPADKPVPPDDAPWIILSIPTRAPLPGPEADALRTYWEATWKAGDDAAAQQAALDALDAAVGPARAQVLRADYVPRNLSDPPPGDATRAATQVFVAFLHFPDDEAAGLRLQGWSTTPQARLLPDRLVFMGMNDGAITHEALGAPIPAALAVAPDPQADEDARIRRDGPELDVGAEMAWLTDFDRAVEVGMGFRIPLEPAAFRRGFDQVLIMGLRLRSGAEAGRLALQDMIGRHHRSKSGFSILPQGSPTNNVETEAAAYSWREDPDVSFEHYFGTPPDDPPGWYAKTDGRWLAELLGLDPAELRMLPHYGRTDISDARAMNVALWPATLGYFADTMLHPVMEDATVTRLRDFFTRHVTARGTIPAIRIGRQPYGILPVTPRSRMRWMASSDGPIGAAPMRGDNFLTGLLGHLRRIEADLAPLLDRVSFIGKPGAPDPQQILLDVIGLHPGSVEYQQRYAESIQQLYNRLRMSGAGGALMAVVVALGYAASGLNLLQRFGYVPAEGEETPAILEKFFTTTPHLLKGGLIDDVPLSETAGIRAYTGTGANYLQWLHEAAATSHAALSKQEGFAEGRPTALLYHMARHALDLSYVETSVRLFLNAGLMTQADFKAARREPEFIQVTEASLAAAGTGGNSRWQHLYRREPAITGVADRKVGDFIPTVLNTMTATAYLRRQLDALEHLQDRPTAVLERCLSEHLDLCTYRLDAWYGGLMSAQLERMRFGSASAEDTPATTGLYLGAWGWLEDVRPEFKKLQPVDLPRDLAKVFDDAAAPPLTRDQTNQGYIHAPSLNHAVTAAVLRNGYLSNATPGNPGSLAVNLTSERVRMALSVIEGLKADQNMSALLGYQFERGLHDRHDVEVDEFIYDLRKVFPLAGDRLRPTKTGKFDTEGRKISVRQVEARNVIDGLALVDHLKSHAKTYPFGLGADLPPATPAQAAAISAEAVRLLDIADAVADLAMAESVHQVVQGNYDRAGAVLDTYSKGKFPATPDVIRTPRTGVTLTHRIALHLPVGLDPTDPARISPRARTEPALDVWLSGVLPAAARVACRVTVSDPAGGPDTTHIVTQTDLGLAPIDLLYLLDPDDDKSGKVLDDLIEAHVIATHAPRPDARMVIGYRERIAAIADHVPFFELTALIRPLRSLLLRSRPLRPTDMALPGDAQEALDLDVALDAQRIEIGRDALAARRDALVAFATPLVAEVTAEPPPLAAIITQIDATIAGFATTILQATHFAGLQTGTGDIFAGRARIFAGLLAALEKRVQRMDDRLAEFDAAIAAHDADAGAPEADRFPALMIAERFIAVQNTDPLPPTADGYRDDLVNISRPAFVAERDALVAVGAGATTIAGLHDGLQARVASLAIVDPEPFDLGAHGAAVLTLAEDMAHRAQTLAEEMTARLVQVQALLDAADAAADLRRQVEDRTKAAQLLFGEDYQIVPDFALPAVQGAEWRSAWGAGASADRQILDYQETTLGRAFPVDDWLMGMARVREKIGAFETTTRLTEAFGTATPVLQPLQFPHRADLPWLALEFPETLPDGSTLQIDEDKLLYTGHFAAGFDENQRQAGLMIDEVTEMIPSRTEDTGLAFHYDRPNSEPPQTLLLALPPVFTGSWRWQDLVDSVRETMDLARKRAIEPDQIDTTAYGRFLPAVVSAVTLYPITAALNFSEMNNISAVMAANLEAGTDE